jgi:hypothetical protein
MRVVDLKIGTTFVPNAVAGQGYGFSLARLGGVAPYTWSLTSGALPPGLVLSASTGLISGTPAAAGAGIFTVRLSDSTGANTAANLVLNVLPELPRSVVDTTVPAPGGGSPILLSGGAGAVTILQAVISTAPCGAIVKLHAGDTWDIGSASLIFPRRSPECTSATPITITTDDPTLPATGNRVTPADSAKMPKIVSSTASVPVLDFSQGASAGGSFYRIVGVEITVTGAASTSPFNGALVKMGSGETAAASMPHDVFIDRSYIHGTATSEVQQGVSMNGVKLAVIDSNISEIHQTASDSQAIVGWNGPGPYKIQNNRLEAAGESILFGGTVPANNDNVSADIVIQNNYLFKPLSWQTAAWLVKNHLEIKNAQRVLIQGNVLENNWNNAQSGFAVQLTPRGPASVQGGPSTTVSEITIKDNEILHVGGGVFMTAVDNADPLVRGKDISLINNVVLDANNLPLSQLPFGANGKGYAIEVSDGVPNLTIDHNSGFATQALLFSDNPSATSRTTGLLMRQNLFSHTSFGLFCNGVGEGAPALNTCSVPPSPDFFSFNVLIGASSSLYPSSNTSCTLTGASCYPVDQVSAGITDPNNCNAGTFDFTKCALQTTSPYKAGGLDGTDLGANINAVAQPLSPSVNPVKP